MMKRILLTALLAMGVGLAGKASVPLRRHITHVQPDGTTITLTATGNGKYVTYTTDDGIALLRGADGHFYYAQATADNNLTCAPLPAHNAGMRSEAERRVPTLSHKKAENMLRARFSAAPIHAAGKRTARTTDDGLGVYKQPGTGVVPSIGTPVIPVVMVNFSDRTFQDTINAAKITRFFNEEGYADEPGCRGSVKDYFAAQSNGLFVPAFEVVATVTVPKGYAYYGANGTNGETDARIKDFITDALTEAERTVDFTQYATNGDIPLVALIFAGPGEQSSFEDGCEDYIWGQFCRTFVSVNEGRAHVSSYFVGNELLQEYGSTQNDITARRMDGIGLFCHEFSHALGLPDFYYTGNDATAAKEPTMDYWSLMDYGMYFFDGYRPVGYTAYERSFLGWLDVKELTEPQYVELYPFGQEEKGPTAYVIRNPECAQEYYLLENRQVGPWHHSMMGTGMLVTHVDYNATVWLSNSVNLNARHQRMSYLPADNKKNGTKSSGSMSALFDGYKGDLFPGLQHVTTLTAETTPALTLFNGTKGTLDMPLFHITESEDGIISFCFIDPDMAGIDAVTADSPQTEAAGAFTLTGRRVTNLNAAAPGIYILPNGKKYVKK